MKSLLTSTLKLSLLTLWRIETLPSDQLTASERRSGRAFGIAIVTIILIAAAIQGAQKYRSNLDSASFYQARFGPAVNFACNGKYNRIKPNEQVRLFLERKSPSLNSCEEVEGLPVATLSGFERSTAYLEVAAAILWKLFGFNWEILWIISAILASGFALTCFALLRVFFESRLVAATFTYLLMSSQPVASQIPHLRDFSKAPLLIGAIACIATATLRQHKPSITLSYAIAAGTLVSLGLGFRADIDLVVPIAILAPLLSISGDTLRQSAARILLIWTGFAVSYLVLQLPLELVVKGASSPPATFIPHVFILGFSESFLHGALGMPDSSYSVLRAYYDELVRSGVDFFAGNTGGPHVDWGSIEYEKTSAELLKSIFLLIPADALIRLFYTANAIGHLPLNAGVWGVQLLLAVPIIALVRPRPFLFTVLTFGTLAAALSLQFDARHAFYMALLGPVLLALSFSVMLDAARWIYDQGLRLPPWIGSRFGFFWLSAGFLGIALASVFQLLAVAQQKALQGHAQTYLGLEWESIKFQPTRDGIEPVLIRDNRQRIAFALKHPSDLDTWTSPRTDTFSKVTIKLQSPRVDALPVAFSWTAVQEKTPLAGRSFTLSTDKMGYAVESSPISGNSLRTLVGKGRSGRHTLALQVTGETLRGEFHIGVLNADRSRFAFVEPLPRGRWQYRKKFEIGPDLDRFAIVFSNHFRGGRSSVRVDTVELVTVPEPNCWNPRERIGANYVRRSDNQVSFGGPMLPDQAGYATYYFPQTFSKNLAFEGLNLGSISPDCVVDWSVAKNFPAKVVPAEFLLVNDQLNDFRRGDWESIWRAFVD